MTIWLGDYMVAYHELYGQNKNDRLLLYSSTTGWNESKVIKVRNVTYMRFLLIKTLDLMDQNVP